MLWQDNFSARGLVIASKGCPQVPNKSRSEALQQARHRSATQPAHWHWIDCLRFLGQPCYAGAASRPHDHPRDPTTMAADPAFFHRDGSGNFHAYDAATNALLEEAYRTQKTCRLPVRGMHLEVRFGAKATSDRVAVPPLSRIVQVNCGAQHADARRVEGRGRRGPRRRLLRARGGRGHVGEEAAAPLRAPRRPGRQRRGRRAYTT